jgi:hypothetical protein
MSTKNLLRQRINIFFGEDIDPDVDQEVVEMLRKKFNIRLPQRTRLNAALAASASRHEIIALLLSYRTECAQA